MRKKFCILLAALMLLSCTLFSVPAYAGYVSGSANPSFAGTGPDCDLYYGKGSASAAHFFVAMQPAEGVTDVTYEYLWYTSDSPDMASMMLDTSAADSENYTISDPGRACTKYVWCGVTAYGTDAGGDNVQSEIVYSRTMRATWWEEIVSVTGCKVQAPPAKTVYEPGEAFDPKGLYVIFQTSAGEMRSANGDDLTFSKTPFSKTGKQDVVLTFDPGTPYTFKIPIEVKAHSHKFGEWKTTVKPTCTEEGVRTRKCSCGESETEAIPAAGHKWDSGKETVKPTLQKPGEMTYTCTACGETRTEEIPRLEAQSHADKDKNDRPGQKPAAPEPDSAPDSRPASPDSSAGSTQKTGGLPWWAIVLLAVGAAAAAGGVTAGILIAVKKSKK